MVGTGRWPRCLWHVVQRRRCCCFLSRKASTERIHGTMYGCWKSRPYSRARMVLASSLLLAERLGRLSHKEEQLRETLRVAYRLSDIFETVPLLEALAEEATRLLKCDRASIFIWRVISEISCTRLSERRNPVVMSCR